MKQTRVVTLNGKVVPYVVHVDQAGGMVTFLRKQANSWTQHVAIGAIQVYPSPADYEIAILEDWYARPSH
jgi:hypothetical protein